MGDNAEHILAFLKVSARNKLSLASLASLLLNFILINISPWVLITLKLLTDTIRDWSQAIVTQVKMSSLLSEECFCHLPEAALHRFLSKFFALSLVTFVYFIVVCVCVLYEYICMCVSMCMCGIYVCGHACLCV